MSLSTFQPLQIWRGFQWEGPPGPFRGYMLTRKSSHIWRADLPSTLSPGARKLEVLATDRNGRTFRETLSFEMVDKLPPLNWRFHRDRGTTILDAE